MSVKILLALLLIVIFLPGPSFGKITPADIVNSNMQAYQDRVKSYSPKNQQSLDNLQQKIAQINKIRTDQLEAIALVQGEILDEYVKRKGVTEQQHDGVHRDLNNPVEKARYWITFAHEAVAYQAAKIYIPNLTSQANIKSDSNNTVSQFQPELEYARGTVIKSQKVLDDLLKND